MKPEFVLGTTYALSLAFFESVVFRHIDRANLKRCLLLCDQTGFEMSMSEAPALRSAARDYMVATAPSKGTFHPKVWLLLDKDELIVLVGSGNLTQPGFIENAELFDVVRVSADGPGRELASDVINFLRGLSSLWQGTSDTSLLAIQTLRQITSAVEELGPRLKSTNGAPIRLLSGFSGSFPSQFAKLNVETAYVASPFFGNSAAGLERLHADLGATRTFAFPAWHRDGTLDLPLAEVKTSRGLRVRSLAMTSNRKKFAHLKLYGFESHAKEAWIFTSSVNCTTSALYGPNVEAGLLRKVAPVELDEYFAGTDLTEGESASHFDFQTPRQNWLILWATDVGDQINIELAATHSNHAPLTNATIELRTGQRTASTQLVNAFTHGGTERVPWRYFEHFRASLRNAAVLRLTATDAQGRQVHGQCLVDDFATLTSDPIHRSAWRAAVAMLGVEGMPEYGDIAALFSLAEVVASADDQASAAETEEELGSLGGVQLFLERG